MSWEEDTVPCPYCRREIHEDSVRCPYCEHYLSEEDAPQGRPWWILVCAIVCLLIALGWAFLRL